jgi:hypothetical protein
MISINTIVIKIKITIIIQTGNERIMTLNGNNIDFKKIMIK